MKTKFLFLLTLLTCSASIWAAQLSTFATLPSGSVPQAGLVIGKNGDFYGTLFSTDANPGGAIFDLTAQGYLFPLIPLLPAIGANPAAPLAKDRAGNLYGTASAGGVRGNGTVFEWSVGGTLSRVAAFNGTNGSRPLGPVILNSGIIFGAAFSGGTNSTGSVFSISNGVLTNLASFNQASGGNSTAGLVFGPNNSLFGTTQTGGRNSYGTVFSLGTNGVLRPLAYFSATSGGTPGTLTDAPDGNFYGVTTGPGMGAIFKITRLGQLTTLHQFRGPDGATPNSPLLVASDGNLYGTTQAKGSNGFGNLFCLTIAPSNNFTVLASFDGTNGAYPQGGLIQAADGNFYGTDLGLANTGAVFQYGALAPQIITPPIAPTWASNRTAILSVFASGSQPLLYQWFFNGAAISGATNSAIAITNETTADIGTYSVTISNLYGATNAQTVLAAAPPSITIRAVPGTVTNNALTVQGAASGPIGIAAVRVSLNGAPWGDASIVSTNRSYTNWSVALNLAPGSNTFAAYSLDSFGGASRPVRLNTFYRAPAQFAWITNGFGRIVASQKTNGILVVDRPISFTAVPAAQNLFNGWTLTADGVTTNSSANPLTLLMPDELTLQANFVTNFFPTLAGNYVGLFYNDTNLTPQTSGMVRGLVVGARGGVSGRLILGAASYSFSGIFNGPGMANLTASAANGGSKLNVQLSLPPGATNLTGFVQSLAPPLWSATLTAGLISTAPGSSQYTMLMPPDPANLTGPPGSGYAVIAIRNNVATFSGALADGAAFSETAPILTNSQWFPLYASVDSGSGMVLGWLSFSSGVPEGTVSFIRVASSSAAFYREGFTNIAAVQSSTWTNPPPNQPAIALTNLTVSDGGLAAPLQFAVTVNDRNQLITNGGPTNFLSGTINPKNGVLRITFGNGSGRATTLGVGAVLQSSNSARGYFLAPASAGAITSP